jgi:hypothetical protein
MIIRALRGADDADAFSGAVTHRSATIARCRSGLVTTHRRYWNGYRRAAFAAIRTVANSGCLATGFFGIGDKVERPSALPIVFFRILPRGLGIDATDREPRDGASSACVDETVRQSDFSTAPETVSEDSDALLIPARQSLIFRNSRTAFVPVPFRARRDSLERSR